MTSTLQMTTDPEAIEIRLLLEGMHARYGYDFRNYAQASLRRRIHSRLDPEGVRSVSGLLEKILHDPGCMERLLRALTVHVTSMFRDPGFYRTFRGKIVDALRTYPFVRIWHAGCSSGEEAYSMAILLEEEGLLKRCRIYATDLSEDVLRDAKAGVFPLSEMKEYTANYLHAGGKRPFSDYYATDRKRALFRPALREAITFAQHNLVTDASFNESNVILCRNVMIYFDRSLQDRVHKLLYESLAPFGFLCLGRKESIRFTPFETCYEAVDDSERVYKKARS